MTVTTISLELPWPPRECSPNSRPHWAQKAKSAKAYKQECWLRALANGARLGAAKPDDAIAVETTFFPRDKRLRDADNLMASMKAAYDGVAAALGVDDSRFAHAAPAIADDLGGYVRMRISIIRGEGV